MNMIRSKILYTTMTILFMFILLQFKLSVYSQFSGNNDPWQPLQFLIGNWTGVGSGKPGEGSGACSFSFDLDKKIIIRKNRAEYPPKPGEKSGIKHEDLMIIYQQPGNSQLQAIYFDNEGHVIIYKVAIPEKSKSVVLESGDTDKSPRFRLIYTLLSDGEVKIEFSIAPPGGDFKIYTKGVIKRIT